MPVQCTCQTCGAVFLRKLSAVKRDGGKFCSQSCSSKSKIGEVNGRWRGGPVLCRCLTCGNEFPRSPSVVALGQAKHCSTACYAITQRERTGTSSPLWKGGRSLGVTGYIRLNRKDGNHVFEHRAIMENHLGRRLRTDEQVHHINGDRADNRVENLVVMPKADHEALHAEQRRGVRHPKPTAS